MGHSGGESVSGIPLLVIDDEADHASVDTKDGAFDEHGQPDPEHDPSRINQLIRRLLTLFQQKAYVGYTATPFANIFIHEQAETKEEGPDLFPSSFIISLPAPSDYFGPVHVFGSDGEDEDEIEPLDPGELDEIGYEGTVIDLRGLVSEQILLAYPMRVLCSRGEACRGLCSQCGADLNDAADAAGGQLPANCPSCGARLTAAGAVADDEPADSPWRRALAKVALGPDDEGDT